MAAEVVCASCWFRRLPMVSLNPFSAARPNSPFVALKSGTGKHLLSGAFDGFLLDLWEKVRPPIDWTNQLDQFIRLYFECENDLCLNEYLYNILLFQTVFCRLFDHFKDVRLLCSLILAVFISGFLHFNHCRHQLLIQIILL